MTQRNDQLLESVIHITTERDKRSLTKVLLETLSNLIQYDALILLNVPKRNNDEYLEATASTPITAYQERLTLIPHDFGEQRIAPDVLHLNCVNSMEAVICEDRPRLLFPIIINNRVTSVLDIYGHQHTDESKTLIENFLTIYSNFIAIIDDNEHDTLTGLLNRRTFESQLSELLSGNPENMTLLANEERREEKPDTHYWVAILDIDHFKNINDTYGHVYGDEVLLTFAEQMKQCFRSNDLLFRYGGEEFVVVLTPAKREDAEGAFERFRKRIENYNFPQVGQVTVSIGIVDISAAEHTTTLLEHADQALYYAKEHGRNQVQNYHTLTESGLIKTRHIVDDIELF